MSGSPPPASRTIRHSSVDRCDSNQPSSSYYIPQPSPFDEVSLGQPTFLNFSTYGQISYEVDDTSSAYGYTYNPRRVMDSNNPSVSKYLEDSPHYGQGNFEAAENLFLNAPASVPSNFSYTSDVQASDLVMDIQSPFGDVQYEPGSFLDIPPDAQLIPPDAQLSSAKPVIDPQSPFSGTQLDPDSLLSIPLPPGDASFEAEPMLNIPLSPEDKLFASAPLMEVHSPPGTQLEPEPLLNIPLSPDEAQLQPESLMETRSSGDDAMNAQSPQEEARFSTPECAPDSVHPISAPLSTENQYLRSPSEKSDGSNLNPQEMFLMVGQPAKKASRKDAENIRYESPKNYDENWIMEAFYSSSEEYNSPENVEVKKSNNGEEVAQLDTDESDGRVSIVDRLFAMLQRAERDSGDEGDGEGAQAETRTSQTYSKLSSKPAYRAPPVQERQALLRPQIPPYMRPTQLINAQDVQQYQRPPQQIPMNYAGNLYHPGQVAGPSFHPSMLPSTSSQYPPQQVPQHVLVGQNAQPPRRPAPDPPMFFNAPAPIYQGPPIHQLQQQFPPPGQAAYVPQFRQAGSLPQPLSYQQPWGINVYEPQPPPGLLVEIPPSDPAQPAVLPIQGSEESYNSESSITLERSQRSLSSSSHTDYETSVDLESASVVRETPKPTEEEPRPKGPPFEQKGPTRTKEIGPVPPPPPPSPEEGYSEDHDQVEYISIVDQLERETVRLEGMSIHEVANYDRQTEVEELRTRMCERFQRLYPNLFSEEDNDDSNPLRTDVDDVGDGDPEDGKVIRNGIQLTTRYLALWFPDKKERAEMIPWNIVRKIKPIRLCFLDNRIGHGEYEEFNIGEFVNVTGHMMFAYGDGPEALDETRLFVLDIVRQQMNMLLRRVWHEMVQNHQRKVFTYVNIFGLYKNHPIRLRRLVRYLVEQCRKRHMLYRVMVDQGRKRGQNYFENRMDINETGSTEVLCLKKRAPHIYYALIDAGFENQLAFLCEERRIQECDPNLAKIKMFLKKRYRLLSAEHKELLDYARRVSYCSRTGRLSAFRAHRFHEFLGFPDLQTDLIYILDFLAREIVMEVTYRAAQARQVEQEKLLTTPTSIKQPSSKKKLAIENLELCYYEEGLRSAVGWRKNQDILFGEEEQCVPLTYGKNPWKWESDHDYNKREMAERRELEEQGPWPSRFAYVSSAELFEEHKKVLRGEYWDSCPEDLTKEAFAVANAYAAARQAHINLPEPQVPTKWQQQNIESNEKEHERLKKLLESNSQSELEKRLTNQLVKMMAENNIDDTASVAETDGHTNLEKMTKLIGAVVRKHQSITNA